ncbi:DUF4209 domain-containing protein [Fibrivirga algicola]|nr:DUF4209 domain-containing protein [Fibrivirga algicola]
MKFDENDISQEITKLAIEESTDFSFEFRAEMIAFELVESNNKSNHWKTHFGPNYRHQNDDGTVVESPSFSSIDCNMVKYWNMRGEISKNPILKSRYLGLVYDFEKKVCETKTNHLTAIKYIESLLNISKKDIYKYESKNFKKLQRALSVSSLINNKILVQECKNEIIRFQDYLNNLQKTNFWKYKFDLLIDNKIIKLTNNETNEIISELESKLTQFESSDNVIEKIDPWETEAVAIRLASFYKKRSDNENMTRVIKKAGEAFEKAILTSSPLMEAGFLEHLYKLYSTYNLSDQTELLLIRIREQGPNVIQNMKKISSNFEIPKETIDDYIKDMTFGTTDEILNRLAVHYIPSKENAKEIIQNSEYKNSISALITRGLYDDKGRTIAVIGPLTEDIEGHIFLRLTNNLSVTSLLLRWVITACIADKKISSNAIIDFISRSDLFPPNRLHVIKLGLDAFFKNDFLSFIHLIIPQIEEAIRHLIEMSGGNTFKKARSGNHYHVKTFDDVLRDPTVEKALGNALSSYFRLVFTDSRGLNLRNDVCHGILSPEKFNSTNADIIIHTLLCLGLLRFHETE